MHWPRDDVVLNAGCSRDFKGRHPTRERSGSSSHYCPLQIFCQATIRDRLEMGEPPTLSLQFAGGTSSTPVMQLQLQRTSASTDLVPPRAHWCVWTELFSQKL